MSGNLRLRVEPRARCFVALFCVFVWLAQQRVILWGLIHFPLRGGEIDGDEKETPIKATRRSQKTEVSYDILVSALF